MGRVLDYGCGKGADARYLENKGYNICSYDPHWNPTTPVGTFDTVLCTYVLNVLREAEAAEVIRNIKKYLTPSGVAYITVRRDIKKEGVTSRGFLKNVVLPNAEILIERKKAFVLTLSFLRGGPCSQ